jgi:Ni/Co efflux regulator RcnB
MHSKEQEMKPILTAASAALIALTAAAGAATAQPYGHDDQRGGYDQARGDNGHHHNWQRGQRISHDEWGRYQRVDWRQHHLRQPPRGYEWRQSDDGKYVLAAVATGLIASIIANSR